MNARPPALTCLFFNELTLPVFLNSPAGRPLAGDLLVECGLRPALSFVLNVETPANYPGIAGLLGGVDVGSLAHPTPRLPAPIVLAPGTAVAATAARSALGLLARPDERLTAVTLLVPMHEARGFGAALAAASRHAIAWDAAACPHEELAEFTRWLAAEKLLTAENFAGLFPYATAPLEATHRQRLATELKSLGAEIAVLTDATP